MQLYSEIVRNSGTPDWIYAGSPDGATKDQPYIYVGPGTLTDSDEWQSHGTNMISRIVGQELEFPRRLHLLLFGFPKPSRLNKKFWMKISSSTRSESKDGEAIQLNTHLVSLSMTLSDEEISRRLF